MPALEKRRRHVPRPEPEVEEDEAAPPASLTRKERMKEKVDCEHCGKRITKHAQLYTHAKNCKGQRKEVEYEPSSPTTTIASYAQGPAGAQSAASSLSPGEDFMERLRKASLAYQQLDRQRHSSVIRNFYGY